MGLTNINNLIFDLGGVIIDLDFPASNKEFANLSGLSVNEVVQRTEGMMLYGEYEKGLISSQQFRRQISDLLQFSASDEAIDKAWCAMLGGMPAPRLQLLQRLKSKYRTFALSNTNDIHVRKFNSIVEESLGSVHLFNEHFEEVYFSHEMKMRKPDSEIYLTVLQEQQLKPAETLFIDDNLDNIQGAANLGIQTLHLQDPQQLISFFNGTR